jgi:Bax protein
MVKISTLVVIVVMLVWPFVYEKPVVPADLVVDTQVIPMPPAPVKKPVKVETYIPVHEVELPDFAAIKDVKQKKKSFFAYLGPHVQAENNRLIGLHNWVISKQNQMARQESMSLKDAKKLQDLYKKYRVKLDALSTQGAMDELLKRLDGLPVSLVLMQGANESAWGTSRFARLGLNFFGKWCYKKGCGVVPNGRPVGKTYEVEAYLSVADSVRSYYKNINTNAAYSLLRDIRADLRANDLPLDAEALAAGLVAYSQRGDHYVEEITRMISFNERYIQSSGEAD